MADHKGVLLLLFDLPSVTNEDHREYYHFKKKLMINGFILLQESCYLKMIRNMSKETLNNNNVSQSPSF